MVVLFLVFLTGSSWNVCLYWFTRTVGANRHKLGGLKQQNKILWQFWRPEVQNRGVGRAVHQGRLSHAFLSAPGGCLQPCSPRLLQRHPRLCLCLPRAPCPLCVCVSYQDMGHVRAALGPHPGASQVVKNPPANAGDSRDDSSIRGSGRSPGGGNGNLLQYSCLENPMDRGAWGAMVQGVTKQSDTPEAPEHAHIFVNYVLNTSK